jgi:hypothetical protein
VGKCQGSGKEPYQVTVDLAEPAFRCTCPSRKFPCKHGMALLLLWAGNDGSVSDAAAPAAFAGEWAGGRTDRASRRADRAGAGGAGAAGGAAAGEGAEPADPAAQAKRLEARLATMTAGLEDLDRWLADLVRQGLASARAQPYGFWDTQAARLVDHQLPGLAERVRALASTVLGRAAWVDHLLAELGRLHLACAAWPRRDTLPDHLAGDLRTYLGWAQNSEDVRRARPAVAGPWQVLGVRQGGDERLRNQRTWLRHLDTGDTALLLDFAAAGGTFGVSQVAGAVLEGAVHHYPGAAPARALLAAGAEARAEPAAGLPGAGSIEEALAQIAATVAANPWCDRVPLTLAQVSVARREQAAVEPASSDQAPGEAGERLVVCDAAGATLPLRDDAAWELLALTGGFPVDLFGEWEDGCLTAVSVALDGRVVPR